MGCFGADVYGFPVRVVREGHTERFVDTLSFQGFCVAEHLGDGSEL